MKIRIALFAGLIAGCPANDVQVFDDPVRQMPQTVEVGLEPVGEWMPGQPGFAVLADSGAALRGKYALFGSAELIAPIPTDCWGPACQRVECAPNGTGFTCGLECPPLTTWTFNHQVSVTGGMVDPVPVPAVDGLGPQGRGEAPIWAVCRYPLSGHVVLVSDTAAI
jgi:hypothetical protein